MNQIAPIIAATSYLPDMVQRAASQLAAAANHAEILEAKEMASAGFDEAKRAARLARAKGAHDEIIANIHRRQADFLEIEAMAKRRLADEYDAAQERGEVAKGRPKSVPDENTLPRAVRAFCRLILPTSSGVMVRVTPFTSSVHTSPWQKVICAHAGPLASVKAIERMTGRIMA